ncbi:MAG TPA: ATP-binding protein [Candidatus Kapabacteria bacterium]|nr:ATP-binding protein [Candidatus Kapabacteria bacterium]
MNEHVEDLERELEWCARLLNARLKSYFQSDGSSRTIEPVLPPEPGGSTYGSFVAEHGLSAAERLLLILSMIPHIRPQMLDALWIKNEATDRGCTEFGGLSGSTHGGFIPTGETAVFILAGDDLAVRFRLMRLFEGDHLFARHNVLHLGATAESEPALSGALVISREYLHRFVTGAERRPNFNSEFPARRIETQLGWEHLVLPGSTLEQLEEIRHWLEHGRTLLEEWGMGLKMRPGFTSLFHGPPGTGKTLAACLLGKYCDSDVYKIDLSMIVSKYIGETEKNLAKVFDMAEDRRWILFFDEADALFGRRTRVDNAHDRFANQEVSFLLQRIEEFNGVVILASNFKSNMDDAFLRRFHSIVSFPMPRPAERRRIWQSAFSSKAVLEPGLDLTRIADRHEVSGGTVMNVVRYASLKALSRNTVTITLADVEEGLRREFLKEGKTMS